MKTRFTCSIVVTLLLTLVGGAVYATQPITYVSSAGLDTAAGSRTAPNATFEAAIANTSDGGEVYVLDPGVYVKDNKTLFITKNITIDGGAGRMGHVRGTISLGLSANKVVLRDLTFNTSSDGIVDETPNSNLDIDNCTFDCHQYAITVFNQNLNATIINSTITGGQGAVWLEPVSIHIKEQVTLKNDTITGTNGAAVFVENTGVDITHCVIANCFEGVTVDSGGFATVEDCNFTHDNTGAIVNSGSALSISNDNFQFNNLALNPIGSGNLVSGGNNQFVFNQSIGTAPTLTTTVE